MPASWLPGLTEQLRQRFVELAQASLLVPERVQSFSTPRRLVVTGQVAARQADREETVWGPSLKVAREASGAWTGAASGFAKKSARSVDQLQQGAKDPAAANDLYLFFVRKTTGREAREVLSNTVIPALLRALTFPKRMNWDAMLMDERRGDLPFGRPIRWIVALLDGEVVPVTIHDKQAGATKPIVTSGAETRGHRFLPPGRANSRIKVSGWSEYQARLREHRVIVDPEERDRVIREGLGSAGGGTVHDFGLLDEWKHLVEWPTVVFGRIPEEFRKLPTEVLQTVLVHHQKYIPLGEGEHVTRFAALTNADRAAEAEIVRGMERVVVARLRDGAFFFAEDMKRPLSDRVRDLAGVTFHQGLGTYAEKAERMVRLVDTMAEGLGILTKPERETAREAARLAKADLTTLMVREFPELQGVMGGIYLRAQGHPQANVAEAVRWHYHPVSIEEGSAPARVFAGGDTTVFGAVSIADKLDTLAGYFGLGLNPTGSSDPFGLRRAAQGVVRVLLDFWRVNDLEKRPNLSELIDAAVAGYKHLKREPKDVVRDLEGFFLDRLESILVARGFDPREVSAAIYTKDPQISADGRPAGTRALADVYDCYLRLKALHTVRLEHPDDFDHLAIAFKRANSLLEQAANGGESGRGTGLVPEAQDLTEPAERGLLEALVGTRAFGSDRAYEDRLRSMASVRPAVDRFFDEVMVMVDDPRVRNRRLALLDFTVAPINRIADISKLGG